MRAGVVTRREQFVQPKKSPCHIHAVYMHTTLVTKQKISPSHLAVIRTGKPDDTERGKGGNVKSRKRRILKCSCGLNEEMGG